LAQTCCWPVVVGVATAVDAVAAVGDDGVVVVVAAAVGDAAAVGVVGGGVAASLTIEDVAAAWATFAWSGSVVRPGRWPSLGVAGVVASVPEQAAASVAAHVAVAWNTDWPTTSTAVGRCWTTRLSA